MTIESIARAHWWHRLKSGVFHEEAQDILLGPDDALAQEAQQRIEDLWQAEKPQEIQAMQAALRAVTLADMLSNAYKTGLGT